jgi:hypothetical protein
MADGGLSRFTGAAMRWYESVVNKIAAASLSFLVLTAVAAHADKKPKKKKNVDLSANPLADVNSKQPDKELFDKAMLAMKKGRFDVAGSTCRPCSIPIPSRNTGCAPSWPWATAGSRKAAPRH